MAHYTITIKSLIDNNFEDKDIYVYYRDEDNFPGYQSASSLYNMVKMVNLWIRVNDENLIISLQDHVFSQVTCKYHNNFSLSFMKKFIIVFNYLINC